MLGLVAHLIPSFGFAGYQDWEPFMPTDFPLAAASGGRPAGWRYQPWVNEGMGGGAGGFAGPDLPQGYNTGGGLLAGGVPVGGPGPINPNIWGGTDTTGGGNTTTDTSGNKWVMSPGGQWFRADSDYGQGLLGTGRLFYDQHYDSSGHYIGAEGADTRNNLGNSPAFSLAERMSGIANDYGGKWGDRQMGLDILGKTGIFGPSYGSMEVDSSDPGWAAIEAATAGGYGTDAGLGTGFTPSISDMATAISAPVGYTGFGGYDMGGPGIAAWAY